jgi:hypothetical protein
MLRTFIQIAALALTIESAWFLARGSLSLSPTTIAELSKPKYGYNLEVARSITDLIKARDPTEPNKCSVMVVRFQSFV